MPEICSSQPEPFTDKPNPYLQDYRLWLGEARLRNFLLCTFPQGKEEKALIGPFVRHYMQHSSSVPDLLNPVKQRKQRQVQQGAIFSPAYLFNIHFISFKLGNNMAPGFIMQFISNPIYCSSLLLLHNTSFLPLCIFVLISIFSLAMTCFYSALLLLLSPPDSQGHL